MKGAHPLVVYQSIYQSTYQSIHLSIYASIYLSVGKDKNQNYKIQFDPIYDMYSSKVFEFTIVFLCIDYGWAGYFFGRIPDIRLI